MHLKPMMARMMKRPNPIPTLTMATIARVFSEIPLDFVNKDFGSGDSTLSGGCDIHLAFLYIFVSDSKFLDKAGSLRFVLDVGFHLQADVGEYSAVVHIQMAPGGDD